MRFGSSAWPAINESTPNSTAPIRMKCSNGSRTQRTCRADAADVSGAERSEDVRTDDIGNRSFENERTPRVTARRSTHIDVKRQFTPATIWPSLTSMKIGLL